MLRPLSGMFAVFALFAAPAFAAHQVHAVGTQAPAQFAEIQDAVNAAADGDVLLVRTGQYLPATIDGKGLTIIGLASPERPQVIGLTIRNLAPTQSVVVRGMNAHPVVFGSPTFLSIDDCLGPVTFEDCILTPSAVVIDNSVGPGSLVRVEASTRVTFSRCTMTATAAPAIAFVPRLGLRVVGSDVAVYDSLITGGRGADAALFFGNASTPGSTAVEVESGSLLLAGCTLTGGRGGHGAFVSGSCFAASDGGAGLVATGGLVRLMDTVMQGGVGGNVAGACPGSTNPGAAMVVTVASIVTIPETLRRFEISSPAFEGNVETTLFTGVPGEPVLLLISLNVTNTFFPGVQSMLHPAPPFFILSLGLVPAGGQIAFGVALPLPLLPAGIEGISLYEQCVVPGNSGFGLLSAPSVRTVIQAGL